MSLDKISSYGTGDVNLTALMATVTTANKGHHQLTLTNMDNDSAPQITEGSVIEVANTLYEAGTNVSISGTPLSGTNYIMMVPSGDNIIPTWTQNEPIYDDDKQGFYSQESGEDNYRYIEITIEYDGASAYEPKKRLYIDGNINVLSSKNLQKSFVDAQSGALTIQIAMTTIVFNTENYDFKKEYNNSTGIFTAKSNGLYTIKASATAGTTASISNEYMSMQIYKNSSDVLEQQSSILDCTATGIYPMYQSVSVKKTVYLERNDTIAIRLHAPYSGAGINANVTYLSIIQEDYI